MLTIDGRPIDAGSKKEVLSSIGQFIEVTYYNLGKKVDCDWHKLSSVVSAYLIDTYESFDGDRRIPSPFKRSANLLLNFWAEKPIGTPIYEDADISRIDGHQNIIIPLMFGIELLHGAKIRKESGKDVELSERIRLSKHSLMDLLYAIRESTPSSHFKLTAFLFEQMAYRFNPDASDPVII
uniref:Uncharacterized protein n=1 Tax=Candidatus Kentrum sp. TC TaxID=2126339 RepID=A0A450YWD0_9GAMM|nr:MAG: hypothetical protein BECKTC1821E_GA0114239_10545 [Candidatus Kentron sp. TC]